MLGPESPDRAQFMPGYGASRALLDAGLSDTFDRLGSLLVALAWLAGLGLLATVLWRRPVGPEPRPVAVTDL